MTKISGRTTFYKKIFPALWFGFLTFFLVMVAIRGDSTPMGVLVPVGMMVFGFFLFRKVVWDLIDEVYDAGDHLIFKNNGLEQRVSLRDIVHIDHQHNNSPERITVHCRHEGTIGKELVFCPPAGFGFKKSSIVPELMERVDRAKRS